MENTNKTISKKMVRVYKQYAPKNLSLERFAQMVKKDPALIEDIRGEFSSFDLELSKVHKNTDDKIVRHKLKDSVDIKNLDTCILEMAKIYEKIICSDESIINAAFCFGRLDEAEIQDLACKIIKYLNKYLHIDSDLTVEYEDGYQGEEKIDVEQNTNKFISQFIGLFKRKKINYHLRGLYKRASNKIVLYKKWDFLDFLRTLSHEYGHFIDKHYANLGGLGDQIASYGYDIYIGSETDKEEYLVNPTEISSFKIGEMVEKHLQNVLLEQGRKRLELLKVKLAALDLKSRKAYAKVYKLERDIIKKRGLDKLPWKIQNFLSQRLEKDKSLVKLQELIKKYDAAYERYNKLYWVIWNIEYMLKQESGQLLQTVENEKER